LDFILELFIEKSCTYLTFKTSLPSLVCYAAIFFVNVLMQKVFLNLPSQKYADHNDLMKLKKLKLDLSFSIDDTIFLLEPTEVDYGPCDYCAF